VLIWQQRTHVPKFGNWESNDNVPYTAYFDKARKGRTGTKMINPNDPEENVDLVLDNSSSDHPPPEKSKPRANSEDLSGKGLVRPTIESHKSLDSDPKQYVDSPARHDNASNRNSNDSTPRLGVGSADNRRRASRQSTAGSEHSVERSPLHRQARAPAGRDSPSWEGKNNSYDSSHGTPGRSRLRPANRGDETVSFSFLPSHVITMHGMKSKILHIYYCTLESS